MHHLLRYPAPRVTHAEPDVVAGQGTSWPSGADKEQPHLDLFECRVFDAPSGLGTASSHAFATRLIEHMFHLLGVGRAREGATPAAEELLMMVSVLSVPSISGQQRLRDPRRWSPGRDSRRSVIHTARVNASRCLADASRTISRLQDHPHVGGLRVVQAEYLEHEVSQTQHRSHLVVDLLSPPRRGQRCLPPASDAPAHSCSSARLRSFDVGDRALNHRAATAMSRRRGTAPPARAPHRTLVPSRSRFRPPLRPPRHSHSADRSPPEQQPRVLYRVVPA